MATRSCCSTPRTAVAGGRSATSAPAPCRSTKRSSASATIHTSWNCARLTIEPRQRIDTQSEDRSLETTVTVLMLLLRPSFNCTSAEYLAPRHLHLTCNYFGQL